MSNQSAISTLVNIFAAPAEAFRAIRDRPTFFVPLLLVCLSASAVNWLYTAEVDIGWLTEQQLRTQTFMDLTEAQIQQMANQAAERSRTGSIATSVIGTVGFVTVLILVQGLYLKIVSAFRKDRVRYMQWLGLIAWTSVPAVLGSIASIVFILTNDVTFMSQTGINPLTFANLLQLDLTEATTAVSAVLSLSPVNFWSLVLVILGYRTISESGLATAAAVVLAPIAVIATFVLLLI